MRACPGERATGETSDICSDTASSASPSDVSLPSPPEAPLVQYAKERENELLSSTKEEVVRLCPATLTVLAASPALSQRYKMFSCTDLVGQSFVHLLHPRHVARVSEYVRQPGHGIDWSTSSCKVASDEACETQAGAHSLAEQIKAKAGMCSGGHSSSGTSDNGNGTTSTKTSSWNSGGSGSHSGDQSGSHQSGGSASGSNSIDCNSNSNSNACSDDGNGAASEMGESGGGSEKASKRRRGGARRSGAGAHLVQVPAGSRGAPARRVGATMVMATATATTTTEQRAKWGRVEVGQRRHQREGGVGARRSGKASRREG